MSVKSAHVTSLYSTAQKTFPNAEPVRRAHQLLPLSANWTWKRDTATSEYRLKIVVWSKSPLSFLSASLCTSLFMLLSSSAKSFLPASSRAVRNSWTWTHARRTNGRT